MATQTDRRLRRIQPDEYSRIHKMVSSGLLTQREVASLFEVSQPRIRQIVIEVESGKKTNGHPERSTSFADLIGAK